MRYKGKYRDLVDSKGGKNIKEKKKWNEEAVKPN